MVGKGDTPIRLGMVGGGRGAFIGAVHRLAAHLDGHFELVAGALSAQPRRAITSALELGIARERAYGSFTEMAASEATREDGIEAVAIVTPNHMHAAPAKAFLKAGIHVICDKPLAFNVAEARELVSLAKRTGRIFALTHNYTGYPMVRQARDMVAAGVLGSIRLVQVEYVQDWLTKPVERAGNKQARWRTDPSQAGAGGALGDIGTHAYNLACFVSGLKPEALLADLAAFVKGRRLDDNDHVLLRFKGGAKGMLWASQVAPGNENGLRLRIFGDRGGLDWRQEEPNVLSHAPLGEPVRRLTRGGPGTVTAARRLMRVPAGHPEGYLEGFANIYAEVARAIRAARTGTNPDPEVVFPTVEDGLAGMRFVAAAVKSSAAGSTWIRL